MTRDGSAQRLWNATLGRLQIQVTRPTFDTWLRDTVALSFEDHHLVVAVPTTFGAEWLEKRMYQLIERAIRAVAQEPIDVSFQVQQPHAAALSWPSPTPHTNGSSPGGNGSNGHTPPSSTLNHRYTFESFMVGSSNQLAHAAALAVAERPGQAYNPLFLYGGVGLGKTHLLHAIAQWVSARGCATRYVSTEQFTNDFISSIKDRRTAEFREKYRSVDVLLIDDIQFICGKEQTQEGFFHTFNVLHNAGRQIVIACDRAPEGALPSGGAPLFPIRVGAHRRRPSPRSGNSAGNSPVQGQAAPGAGPRRGARPDRPTMLRAASERWRACSTGWRHWRT